jgi:16S rRNA (uracil1498-N3)-methyltransferase
VARPEGAEKRQRWRRIVQEAAEQCGRGLLPQVDDPVPLAAALQQAAGLRLLAHEQAAMPLRTALSSPVDVVSLFVGPEGGFDDSEVEAARAAGAAVVSLGPRILRAETAGVAATVAVLYALGDFG